MLLINNNKLIINGKALIHKKKQYVNPNAQIMYTSNTGTVVDPYDLTKFGGATMIENTYENGVGVMTFR